MASNKIFQQVRRTASARVTVSSTAVLAAAMVHLAGTAVSIAQVTPNTTTTTPAMTPAPRATTTTPAQPTNETAGTDGTKTDATEKVHVDGNQIVDLHVNDEDLANVLEMLSIQSQKNIVASKSVTARVTANLYGVTFFEALDAILNVNGFGYVEDGNFIFVYTTKELEEIRKAQRVKISKVVHLNYLNAIDAAEFVKPLLSEGAQIKTNGKTGNFPSPGEVPLGSDEYAGGATLVITDFDDHIGEIESLLHQLDTRPSQVLVEATIMQTTLTEDNAFGVDFSIIADMNFGDFFKIGGPIQAANALIGGTDTPGRDAPLPGDRNAGAVSSNVGNTSGPGGLKLGIVKGDVAVFMRVLDEVTDTTILSNPKILALNRQPARVLVGRKVGYLSTTSTDTATTQTVEFLDTGTQLYFRPFVSDDGVIRMELKPQVSEAVIRDSHDAAGKDVTIPDEITNELVTNVMVHDGQTIVLGGLFRESTQSTRRQIPFLGDIPLIGHAFRGNDDNTQRNEIIFLVTPTIVNDQTLAAQGEKGKEYVDHLRVGSREGVLFFSRDKLTTRRNLKAERAFERGDTESALWNVQRSLSLNHNQPEIVAMREKLTGEKNLWPTRSFLDRVVHGDTEQLLKKGGKAQNDHPMFPGNQTAEASDGLSLTTANFNTSFSTNNTTDGTTPTPTTPTTPTTGGDEAPFTPTTPDSATPSEDGSAFTNEGTPAGPTSSNAFNGTPTHTNPSTTSNGATNNTTFNNNFNGTPSGTTTGTTTGRPTSGRAVNGGKTAPNSGARQNFNSTTPATNYTAPNSATPASPSDGSTTGFYSNGQAPTTPATGTSPTTPSDESSSTPETGESNTTPTDSPWTTPSQTPTDESQPSPAASDDNSGPMEPAQDSVSPTDDGTTSGTTAQAGGSNWTAPANVPVTTATATPSRNPAVHGVKRLAGAPTAKTAGTRTNNTAGATPIQTVPGAAVATTEGTAQAPAARLWCGRHSFMQGMWSFFKFSSGQTPTPVITEGPESTTPESTDR